MYIIIYIIEVVEISKYNGFNSQHPKPTDTPICYVGPLFYYYIL